MGILKETRSQTITFETSPEELRGIANYLENNDITLENIAIFYLNDENDNFDVSICLKFLKNNSKLGDKNINDKIIKELNYYSNLFKFSDKMQTEALLKKLILNMTVIVESK